MCARCADFDYPIAACWRPCYQPPSRPRSRGVRIPGEEDFEADRIIGELRGQLRTQRRLTDRLRAENEALRADPKRAPSGTPYAGLPDE